MVTASKSRLYLLPSFDWIFSICQNSNAFRFWAVCYSGPILVGDLVQSWFLWAKQILKHVLQTRLLGLLHDERKKQLQRRILSTKHLRSTTTSATSTTLAAMPNTKCLRTSRSLLVHVCSIHPLTIFISALNFNQNHPNYPLLTSMEQFSQAPIFQLITHILSISFTTNRF